MSSNINSAASGPLKHISSISLIGFDMTVYTHIGYFEF